MVKFKKSGSALKDLLNVMAALRSPQGCPWDREQDHMTLRYHAVEEVYELMDAIEAGDEAEMVEELGDLLLQVVFHCQMASERGAFTFEDVARHITEKLLRRHPHVFGDSQAKTVDAVWAQWEKIKRAEKSGTHRERASALDGIPAHLPALLKGEKLVKKARKAGLLAADGAKLKTPSKSALGAELFHLVEQAQAKGWSAEDLLRAELKKREKHWRAVEKKQLGSSSMAHRKSLVQSSQPARKISRKI